MKYIYSSFKSNPPPFFFFFLFLHFNLGSYVSVANKLGYLIYQQKKKPWELALSHLILSVFYFTISFALSFQL